MNDFFKRLKEGQKYESFVMEHLNFHGLNCHKNNEDSNEKDIDLYLPNQEVFLDVKYCAASADRSIDHEDLDKQNCLILSLDHHKQYVKVSNKTKKDVWIGILVDFEEFGIKDMVFIRNSYIEDLRLQERAFRRSITTNGKKKTIINFSKKDCITLNQFIVYLNDKTKYSDSKYGLVFQ